MSKYVDRIPDPIKEFQVPIMQTVRVRNEDGSMKIPVEYKQVPTGSFKIKKMRNVVLKWHEVRDQVRAVVERGEAWPGQPSGHRLLERYENPSEKEVWDWDYKKRREHYTDSMGRRRWRYRMDRIVKSRLASGADIQHWFANGFRSEEFENLAERVPAALAHRPTWNEEEGDVEVARLVGGWDDFYMGPVQRPSKPGVRVQIEMAFAAGVDQKTIEQYGAWVNSLLGSMEAYGIDMVVDLWIPLDNLFEGDSSDVRTNVLIRVKNANEVSDFTDWSILFSPAGYRQVGFAAKCVAGDKIGKRVTSHYGMTIGGKTWGLEYDRDESTVRITANQRAYAGEAIPFEALTELAVKEGLIPDPAENTQGINLELQR